MKNAKLLGMMAMGGVLALSLAGCGEAKIPGPLGAVTGVGHESVSDDSDDEAEGFAKAAKEKLDDQVSLDEDYWFRSGKDIHHIIVFTNNSSEAVEVSSNSEALDDDGEVLGVGKDTVSAVGPNCKGVIHEQVRDARRTASFNTKISATKDQYNDPVTGLSAKASVSNRKTIVKITNNDEKTAEDLSVNVLFFKDGRLVGFDQDDYSLGDLDPGDSESDEFSPMYSEDDHEDYDSVEVVAVGSSDSY